MGRVILAQCKGGSAISRARTVHHKYPAELRSLDYAERQAALTTGNVIPLEQMPEGNYATIVSHNPEGGIVTGGRRIDKPILKAGRSYHQFKAKRKAWPRVRGVAMNPVDHSFGGGNHQQSVAMHHLAERFVFY
ncbi:unnamed protein product [Adineta steineri]|uniref:Large ribosomal subunit protein uL2 n=1 Tax=Adineta steineri TaxID=433720 RepID=A0A815R215_9BILA|nr:unnamed protein product [Adineta steineri]